MICGALQTLNEDAFEDVAISERPSPTGELTLQQYLAPISEELGSPSNSRICENFLDNTSKRHSLTSNSSRTDDFPSQNATVIFIPNYTPSIDDTHL